MLEKDIKYGYSDIAIVPTPLSSISSRKECNCFYKEYDPEESKEKAEEVERNWLPLFTAPMDSVIDLNNYKLFKENDIHPIIPRTVDLEERLRISREEENVWIAYSLKEFDEIFNNFDLKKDGDKAIRFANLDRGKIYKTIYALIDIANGHMKKLYDIVKKAKATAKILGWRLVIMIGNIANPESYKYAALAGADYVRLGIGGGGACITSTQTGVNYPMASLVYETYLEKKKIEENSIDKDIELPKIVADGGARNYADIIKALALGADYVMCGSIFVKMWESAAKIQGIKESGLDAFSEDEKRKFLKEGYYLEKEYWGMSTKRSQKLINKDSSSKELKTSEGTKKLYKVEYTMKQWVENMEAYLKSAMSYVGITSLENFIGVPKTIVISESAKNAINK